MLRPEANLDDSRIAVILQKTGRVDFRFSPVMALL
jgi:hypothetical protein